jgi:hypothetical protein
MDDAFGQRRRVFVRRAERRAQAGGEIGEILGAL